MSSRIKRIIKDEPPDYQQKKIVVAESMYVELRKMNNKLDETNNKLNEIIKELKELNNDH